MLADGVARPGSLALLDRARAEIDRLTPHAAFIEQQQGAIIVDVRTEVHRESAPSIPGSLAIDLTVLPWRLDPGFDWRIPEADRTDRRWILICRHGYSSSLAAWNLRQMGLTSTADVIGGFEAWQAAHLPTTDEAPDRRP
ncbi:rhodanese-like domain-containing protein [Brevibacterium sediminis]|uniref:Rhodanese-like domain-containing protein n=1 Tax=Brevibacterium sediminis TaxID=1857024 RepID=A0A5C4X3X0_9MICO|nr:rhodanese-like domain-containing protein [Brevibacterium sediminis]TNM56681.1 rhodanese-like domain-containing protein [Brevibacterium sediminis]GGC43289.1 sulfurtransferase [Brevibacterium sediminis]